MRERFNQELNDLNNELIKMGAMCEEAINKAVKLLEADSFDEKLYSDVESLEEETDKKEKEIESRCLKLIFSQQPVASDLRLISAVLKMISDLERIADQAQDIADLTKEMAPNVMRQHVSLGVMGRLVATMVNDSVASFVKRDTTLAKEVMKRDEDVNKHFDTIKNEVAKLISGDDNEGETLVDILMIAKYLERIGDHSTNIAEWVDFAVNG